MTTTNAKGPEVLEHLEADAHNIPAGDLMNISTVTHPTDTDVKVPGFHRSGFADDAAAVYLLMTHEEPRNPSWTTCVAACPASFYTHISSEKFAEMIMPGYVWGDVEDDVDERRGEMVFTSLGLHEFVGYEVDFMPGVARHDAFTGVFRKFGEAL